MNFWTFFVSSLLGAKAFKDEEAARAARQESVKASPYGKAARSYSEESSREDASRFERDAGLDDCEYVREGISRVGLSNGSSGV